MSENTPLQELSERLKEIGGCSNGGCKVYRPTGMVTNGPCHCLREDKYKAERVIGAYKHYVRMIEGEEKSNEARI